MLDRHHIDAVLAHLRARDRRELAALGFSAADAAFALAAQPVLARAFHDDAGPQALVAFHAVTPATVAASLLATDRWPRVARQVFRWGHVAARPFLLARGYRRAECRTQARHDDAIRFLERLGFVRECDVPQFGADGATFLQYAWRLNDHVPLQIAQGPAAAAPAATT